MCFQTQNRMARETSKFPQLFLLQGDTNNNAELSENQANNVKVQSKNDMDKLSNLKPNITKKWFRKQFDIRKDKAQLEGGERLQVLNVPAFRRERRRSSSLPDLSAMLDAANLRRHGSFISFSPGPARMADKEIVANLKGKNQESLKEGNKANGSQKRDKDDGQEKTRGQELKGTATQMIINTGLAPKIRRRSRSVPDLSEKLDEKSQTCQGSFTTSSPETANLARKKAILSEEAPWLFQTRKRCPTDPNLQVPRI